MNFQKGRHHNPAPVNHKPSSNAGKYSGRWILSVRLRDLRTTPRPGMPGFVWCRFVGCRFVGLPNASALTIQRRQPDDRLCFGCEKTKRTTATTSCPAWDGRTACCPYRAFRGRASSSSSSVSGPFEDEEGRETRYLRQTVQALTSVLRSALRRRGLAPIGLAK